MAYVQYRLLLERSRASHNLQKRQVQLIKQQALVLRPRNLRDSWSGERLDYFFHCTLRNHAPWHHLKRCPLLRRSCLGETDTAARTFQEPIPISHNHLDSQTRLLATHRTWLVVKMKVFPDRKHVGRRIGGMLMLGCPKGGRSFDSPPHIPHEPRDPRTKRSKATLLAGQAEVYAQRAGESSRPPRAFCKLPYTFGGRGCKERCKDNVGFSKFIRGANIRP